MYNGCHPEQSEGSKTLNEYLIEMFGNGAKKLSGDYIDNKINEVIIYLSELYK